MFGVFIDAPASLKLGDQNTNFFHKAVKARNSRNSIKFITMENGCRIDDPATIRQKFVEHFQSVLGSSMQDTADVEFNTDGLVWSSEHLDILNSRITHEEIKKSMFSIDDAKAPGPDGFSSLFFKRAWSIVGSEVCDAVTDFFSSGCLLREINCTIIALVPKVPNPSSMHDYRPISCCNTIYKCISKIIAARLSDAQCVQRLLDLFPNAFTEVLPPGLSDHCPLVTNLRVNPDPGPRKLFPFKFFNFWADHPEFIGLVKEAWSNDVFGTPMFRLTRKLKGVKAILKAFNFRSFGNLHERVVAAREALCQAQSAMLNCPSNPMLGEIEKSCLKNYHDLAIAEEGFLKQKSRVQWLKLGDQNSSFFHKAVKARNARSALKVITMAAELKTRLPSSRKL